MKKLSLKINRIEGEIIPPADKSITHRAIILGALAKKGLRINRALISGDTLSTVDCFRKLGKEITIKGNDIYVAPGPLKEPIEILNCQNSGTTARLLAGLLSAQPFYSVIDGDNSLRQRPMKRIVGPLSMMGARIFGRQEGAFLPISIKGGELQAIDYELPVASAQVKSAILLAGLFTEGQTTVREKIKSRDHLERMLKYFGQEISLEEKTVKIRGKKKIELEGGEIAVPGDISSAAFLITAAVLVSKSRLIVRQVNYNPTRIGFIKKLLQMGARLSVLNLKEEYNEEVADLEVKFSELKAVEITAEEVPALIDEIPLFALLATQAIGISRISGAKELRYKECDRLRALYLNLRKMGARIEEQEDGLIIEGPTRLKGAEVQSFNDHRIAMTMIIAALIAEGEMSLDILDCIQISYPEFRQHLLTICH
jgi:3-phosphoshikimate 1-carboxyvinyltransferase